MATEYVIIGHAESGGVITDGKKLDVLEWHPVILTPVESQETLGNSSVQSIGVPKRAWRLIALVKYSSPATGYASFADVESWFTATTLAGNTFKYQDMKDTTVYNVILMNRGVFDPSLLSAIQFDPTSYYSVPLEFKQV